MTRQVHSGRLLVGLVLFFAEAAAAELITDSSWKIYRRPLQNCPGQTQQCFPAPPDNWWTSTFDDSSWTTAVDEGQYGNPIQPGNGAGVPSGTSAHWIWSVDTRVSPGGVVPPPDHAVTNFRKTFVPASSTMTVHPAFYLGGSRQNGDFDFPGLATAGCMLFIDGSFFSDCTEAVTITGMAVGVTHLFAAQIECNSQNGLQPCGLVISGDTGTPPAHPAACFTDSVAYGTNAQACPYRGQVELAGTIDSYDNHWYSATGVIDVGGVVVNGGCTQPVVSCVPSNCTSQQLSTNSCVPGACNSAHLAGNDDRLFGNHQDRDFEFNLVPDNFTLLGVANLSGGEETPGALAVEGEFMYQYPILRSVDFFSAPIGQTLAGTPYAVPWPGDALGMRGRHILDCGHVDYEGNARAEIHPAAATVWLHPKDNPDHTAHHSGTIWFHAISHFPDPAIAPFGSPYSVTFAMPGGALAGSPLYIGPVQLDWQVDPVADSLSWPPCDDGSSGTQLPWKHLCPSGSTGLDTNATTPARLQEPLWSTQVKPGPTPGSVVFTISPNYNPATTLPSMVGGHVQVCYPECGPDGLQNACPGLCPGEIMNVIESILW